MGISAMFSKKYAKFYNIFNSKKPYQEEINFVYRWAGRPKTIFDIGCGTANYWKFYPYGVQVVGIEKSKAMIGGDNSIIQGDITKYKCPLMGYFDCATALFDVVNYIPQHDWWKHIPIKRGGSFIFDVWDKKKVDSDGFLETFRSVDGNFRIISPLNYDGKRVDLRIECISADGVAEEEHRMYVHSHEDIKRFCGKEFEIVEVKPTKNWQTWYLCRRK